MSKLFRINKHTLLSIGKWVGSGVIIQHFDIGDVYGLSLFGTAIKISRVN